MIRPSLYVGKLVSLFVLMAIAGSSGAQQVYPNRLIRLIVPYAPGGSTTNVARIISLKLTENWGQPVIVDNRPGGNTIIGTEAVAKAPADGYTILLGVGSHVLIPLLVQSPYDALRDFSTVGTLANSETILLLNPSVPANSLDEFIRLAKSRPGQINYSTGGSGTATHLASELFNRVAGIDTRHIAYKGAAPALTDLVGGHIQMAFGTPSTAMSLVKSGKLKAIAVTGEARLPALPQVPTFAEAGQPKFEMSQWFGILAPSGTPSDILSKLSSELAKMVAMPDVRQNLIDQGMTPLATTPDQLASMMKSDAAKFAAIIKAASITLDQ